MIFRTATIGIAAIAVFSLSSQCLAENIIFPRVRSGISDASGIIDVTLSPYFADKTGKTDVTAILQKACDEHQNMNTIYLPNGTYLVSNTITISPPCVNNGQGTGCTPGPVMQGQSKAGTIIRLAPGSFASASSPKPVLTSGDWVAQEFQKGIYNLTVQVGPNNPGANGIRWFSNNQGLMADVAVVSDDGGANIGVDIGGGEQGPCGMRDISIKGFAIGIQCKEALNSVTCWNLTIENSKQYGVLNTVHPLYIENVVCINAPVGVRNEGSMTLLNAKISGGSATKSAVENTGLLYARGIAAQGYGKALTTSSGAAAPSGLTIDEYASRQVSLFPSPTRSIGLPYKQMPDVPWEQDTTKWGNVWVAKGGLGSATKSDIAALQGLIDNPAINTICIPAGRSYQIDADVFIRGNIRRIVGTGGRFIGSGRLVVTSEGTQPVIKIERVNGIPFINQSNKTVILESYLGDITTTGTGDFFISDVCSHLTTNAPSQRIWAWQLNAEASTPVPKVDIQDAYAVRIFGWKDEPNGQSIGITKGILELLGFMYYASWTTTGQTMFVIKEGAQFSAACVTQVSFNGTTFSNLVAETRAGVTKTLTSSANSGDNMALYTGYEAAKIPADVYSTPVHQPIRIDQSPKELRIASGKRGMLTISWSGQSQQARVDLYSASGAHAASIAAHGPACRMNALPAGIYRAVVSGEGFQTAKSVVITR